ncbi:MAG: PTS sugar transporter subunit IIA [Akkermansia muciniphila]|nr:PTS sugar transporter subunit IIA [Akkermansia muciniphila]
MFSSPLLHLFVIREPLEASDSCAAIRLLAQECLRRCSGFGLPADLAALAREREEEIGTYLGHGTALPHARVPGLAGPLLCVARSSAGIPWPEQRAHLIFFLAVPEHQPELYLQFVSRLLRWRTKAPASLLEGPPEALHTALAQVLLPEPGVKSASAS